MPFLHIAVLTIIQGITEFLPVSSSGHLVLVPLVTGWQDQGLIMDVAVHVGTLAAVLVYFSRDLWHMVLGWIGGHWRRHDRRLGRALGFYLIVSAVPVIVAGGVLYVMGHAVLRDRRWSPGRRSVSGFCSMAPIASGSRSGASSTCRSATRS